MQIDLEEAQFQAHQRKDAIERAKTQQYYQTDRVKSFHVSLTLSLVKITSLCISSSNIIEMNRHTVH